MNIFQIFEEADIVRANPTEVSTGLWSNDVGTLFAFFTSSTQTGSTRGQYEWDIFNLNPVTSTDEEIQFAIAYGHKDGKGASRLDQDNNALLPTQATYFQYRNILLTPEDQFFTFAAGSNGIPVNSPEIFVINMARQRIKEKLDPGNWKLTLVGPTGTSHSFIDDSGQTLGSQFGTTGQVFNVVKGTLTGVSGSEITAATSSTSGGFGLVYPSVGIIVFNALALKAETVIAETALDNPVVGVRDNIKRLLDATTSGSSFQARSAENISSTHFFVRLRNTDFNYTNNPTFFEESDGSILNPDFIRDPQVFVTTVGLYNDNNELLAVAKLSQPLRKAFDREALVRIRLDF